MTLAKQLTVYRNARASDGFDVSVLDRAIRSLRISVLLAVGLTLVCVALAAAGCS